METTQGIISKSMFSMSVKSSMPLATMLIGLKGYAENNKLNFAFDNKNGQFILKSPTDRLQFMVSVKGSIKESEEGLLTDLKFVPIAPVIGLGVFGVVAMVWLFITSQREWAAMPVILFAGLYIYQLNLRTTQWELTAILLPSWAQSTDGAAAMYDDFVDLLQKSTRPIYIAYTVFAGVVVTLVILWGLRIIELDDIVRAIFGVFKYFGG